MRPCVGMISPDNIDGTFGSQPYLVGNPNRETFSDSVILMANNLWICENFISFLNRNKTESFVYRTMQIVVKRVRNSDTMRLQRL